MSTPSPSAKELKKRLLRQAVEDNLSTRQGRYNPSPDSHTAGSDAPGLGSTGSDGHRLSDPSLGRQRPAGRRAGGETRPWGLTLAVIALVLLTAVGVATLISQGFLFAPGSESSRAELGVVLPASPEAPTAPVAPAPIFAAPGPIDATVFPLAVRRIVIDPGHGGEDTGTTGSGLSEKDLTLDIASRLSQRLKSEGFEVYLTRDADQAISLRERALFANQLRADLFVSIHINWIVQRSVRGLETYFLGATDDPELSALTRRENRDSGYSLSDMKRLLESIYSGVRQDESRQLARAVQESLYQSLLRENPRLRNRGVKTAPFVVLVATEMPAILAEVSCLSNAQEAELLARPLYRDHIADAMARGIRRYADEVNQSEAKGS